MTMTPDAAESLFITFIRGHGTIRPSATRRYEPVPAISDDGITDCWTHAWEHAEAFGLRYVEGTCMKRPGVLATHAWCETGHPLLGTQIVELTDGFEAATTYVGLTIDTTPDSLPVSLSEGWYPRSSVLQAALAAGFTPDDIHRTLAAA